jgi:UDP-glucuronate decarboxylase
MENKKNVLLIGGAGFIGSHLAERLLRDSNVICVDNFVSSSEKNINHLLKLPNFQFIRHDMKDPLDLSAVEELKRFQLNVFGINEIYNLACPSSVKNFEKLQKETILANTVVLLNALDIAVKYKSKFMQFSSSVVYGAAPRDEFVNEAYRGISDMLDPRGCYDEGKRYAESIVDTYRRIYSLDTKIVRLFRTYGPRMLINDGQIIPDFIVSALENKDVVVYGNEDFRSSLCYVSDVVEGCVKVMDSDMKEPVNLGSTDVYRVGDVAGVIIQIASSSSVVKFEPAQMFLRELAIPDITKVKEALGWFPVVTLEEGLQKTIDYTRAHKDLLTFSTEF